MEWIRCTFFRTWRRTAWTLIGALVAFAAIAPQSAKNFLNYAAWRLSIALDVLNPLISIGIFVLVMIFFWRLVMGPKKKGEKK